VAPPPQATKNDRLKIVLD